MAAKKAPAKKAAAKKPRRQSKTARAIDAARAGSARGKRTGDGAPNVTPEYRAARLAAREKRIRSLDSTTRHEDRLAEIRARNAERRGETS